MADNDFTLQIGGDFRKLFYGLKKAQGSFRAVGSDAAQAFKAPQASLQNLSSQIQSFGSVAKGVMAGLVGAVGFKSLTKDFMDYHTNLANAVQLQGYNVTQLEAIGGAMRRFGGDTQGAVSSLDNLSSALHQAQRGGGALIETASMYGINFMKSNGQVMSAEELLQSLSKQLNTFDSQTKEAIASQLGLDKALLRVIDSGNYDGLIAQQKKLNKTTQKDLQVATEFESAWLDLKDSFAGVAKQVSLVLLPPLTKLIKWFTDGLQKFKSFQNTQVLGWGAVGVAIFPLIGKLSALVGIFKTFTSLSGGLSTISSLFSSIGTVIKGIMSPFSLIIGAFIILYAIVDDLYAYFNGEGSVFGDLAKKYPMVEKFLNTLGGVVDFLKGVVKDFLAFLENPSWESFSKFIWNIILKIKDMFLSLISWIGKALMAPIKWMIQKVTGWIPDKLKKMIGISDSTEESSDAPPAVEDLQYMPLSTLKSPESLGGTTVNNNNTTNKTEITQNIVAPDPKQAGEQARLGVEQGMEKVMINRMK